MRINYSGNLYIHSDTNHTFQKYKFKACITLHLSNTFFNVLSFTLLNSELAVTQNTFRIKIAIMC